MATTASEITTEYVTAMVGEQLFGLPISRVQDVFIPERLTRVPLAARDVAGVLNLRGRIVTAINLGTRLGLTGEEKAGGAMAIGVEQRGESYCLLIDTIGEVLTLKDAERDDNPVNLDKRLSKVAAGVFRLDNQIMVVLDIDSVLDMEMNAQAA